MALMLGVLICTSTIGQQTKVNTLNVPEGINYQAVARDADGVVMENATLNVRISIINGGTSESLYSETHSVSTNPFGMFSLAIGQGTPVKGTFADVPWSKSNQWLQVEVDTKGGNDYRDMVIKQQLLSVPYAIYAGSAGSVDGLQGDSRAGDDWLLVGNAGTTAGTNFIGTTDAVDLVIKANNTEHIRVKTGGKVGIGTSSPLARLHIRTTSGIDAVFIDKTSYMGLGIGTNNPKSHMHFKGNTPGVTLRLENTGSNGRTWAITSNRDGSAFATGGFMSIYDYSASAVRAVIDTSGNLGIGTALPTYRCHINGKLKSDGITESSDVRWKKNISTMENALDKVLALRGVTYQWRVGEFEDKRWDEKTHLGFIAQEVEKILPEVVDTDNQGYKSVQYGHVVSLLVEAVKEQQQIIAAQRSMIEQNTAQIEGLQNALESAGVETQSYSVEKK